MAINNLDGHWSFRRFRVNSYLGQLVPWSTRTLFGQLVPWSTRTPGQLVPQLVPPIYFFQELCTIVIVISILLHSNM